MKPKILAVAVILCLSVVLVACGNSGEPTVPMETYDGASFDIDYPQGWTTAGTDMMGVTILVSSSVPVDPDVFMESDPADLFSDAPGLVVMQVPQAMAAEGNLNLSADELRGIVDQDSGFEVIREGEVTIDGVAGYEVIAQGSVAPESGLKMGIHMLILEGPATVLSMTGFSPEQDLDQNLAIFEQMARSIDFD